jgi:hypothetical protein
MATKSHALTITRNRTDACRVEVVADSEEEARLIVSERAKAGDLLWEEQCSDLTIEVEGK